MDVGVAEKTGNEIDHALINDMKITKDMGTLAKFEFSSNHRITRIKIKISRRSRIQNYEKK